MATPPDNQVKPPGDSPEPIEDKTNDPKNESSADPTNPSDEPITPPVAADPVAPTTIGTYVFVGMLYFVIVIAIINLPYINGMMISVYFFVLFMMIVVMSNTDQFIRVSIMIQLSIGYFLLFLLKTFEFKGQVQLYNIDTLIRFVIITTFAGIVPFILPNTVDFVKYITTREI